MNDPDVPLVGVLLVDDQELVRSGLRRILRRKDGFNIVGECADGDEVPDAIRRHGPDVVVMDLRMKRIGGVDAVRTLCAAGGPPALALTTFDDDDLLSEALRAGACGFILKDSPAEELIRAVHAVARGEAYLDPAVTARVLTDYRRAPGVTSPDVADKLTARERDVLELIGSGATNAEIAGHLVISEVTVKSHIGRIFTKLDLRDRAAAIVYAYDHGVVTPK